MLSKLRPSCKFRYLSRTKIPPHKQVCYQILGRHVRPGECRCHMTHQIFCNQTVAGNRNSSLYRPDNRPDFPVSKSELK